MRCRCGHLTRYHHNNRGPCYWVPSQPNTSSCRCMKFVAERWYHPIIRRFTI